MMPYLVVFAGAGIGGALRHGVNVWALRLVGPGFPYGTLAINVAGSLAMGLIAGWFAFRSAGASQMLRLFLTTGILGGFTTFSAFSLETALLWERGEAWSAGIYVVASVLLSLAGVAIGLAVMRVGN